MGRFPWHTIAGAATIALVSQPLQAATSLQVTGVQLQPQGEGLQVQLAMAGTTTQSPQVVTTQRDRTTITDILYTQLVLPAGGAFNQVNPAPGIASLAVLPLDEKTVRIVAVGDTRAPQSQVMTKGDRAIVLGLNLPQKPANNDLAPVDLLAQNPPKTPKPKTTTQPQAKPKPTTAPVPEVVFPQPQPMPTADKPMTMTGDPLQPYSPVPPMLPRAVAPPVGDIAVSDINNVLANGVNLGTDVRIPRLVLQDAPATEVLRLLARTAGLNLVLGADVTADKTVSLDLENESVQDAFNYVLSISELKGNRSGQTIFVGEELPKGLLATTSRTFRVNQAKAADMVSFLGKFKEQLFSQGVLFVEEERLNSVTVVGTPEDMKTAAALIQQGDLRQRQVAVNVKIFELDLGNNKNWNSAASLGIAQYVMNFAGDTGTTTVSKTGKGGFFNVAGFTTLLKETNGRVLSDPTLIVQEGEKANFDISDQILAGINQTLTPGQNGSPPTVATTAIIDTAGLKLSVEVERIDDNGFVTLKIIPEKSAPILPAVKLQQTDGNGGVAENSITLKRQTKIDVGRARLRDGQAMILAGIIDERNSTSATKVPILGDIPLIGSLFRSTSRDVSRKEIVMIVTPQIINDTGDAAWGYTYSPSPDTNQLLQDRGLNLSPDRR